MANLPQARTHLAQLKADLDEFGYAVVGGALNAEQTRQIRERLAEQARLERERGLEIADHVYDLKQSTAKRPPSQWVYGLINKGEVFRFTLVQPLV